ncbi:MAG: spore germination protein [Oscillospiraceae bacterium]|nr:spore germination protein [Oscillospiraceae bacterium]
MYGFEETKTAAAARPENAPLPPLRSAALEAAFRRCADFESRRLRVGAEGSEEVFVCWLDGLISSFEAAEELLRPLCEPGRVGAADAEGIFAALRGGAVSCPSIEERTELGALCEDLTHGRCVLVSDALGRALSFDVKSQAARAVAEPTLEKSLKGSKDSFVESLRLNTALVRRHLPTPRLKLAEQTLGRRSATRVAVLFLEDAAAPETVAALARRLEAIEPDALVSLGPLEDRLVERPLSPFPQLLHTEKPDRLARWLLDGRVALLVDGVPIALALPVSFAAFMTVTGDGNMNRLVASLLTALRYLALVLGMFLPALYASVASFHPEMIPTRLLLSIMEAKKDVPFSTGAELVGMLVAFALLQEAGLRLPNPVGDTVSIIGALIVGQAAVEARLVSPIAIIVVAVSGIACYTMPSQDMGAAVRLCRALLLLAGIAAGLYGVALGCCLIAAHLSAIDSFGQNYTAPLSGRKGGGLLKLLTAPRAGDRRQT